MANKARAQLADALERVHKAAHRGIVKSADIKRADRDRLIEQGYLSNIIKGWYLLTAPSGQPGESTAWYVNYWDFLSVYLHTRFGNAYCLSATHSLQVLVESPTIPEQVIAMSASGGKTSLELPYSTSLLVYEEPKGPFDQAIEVNGLRVMPLDLALCRIPASFYQQGPLLIEMALRSLTSPADLIRRILSGPHIAAARRLAGACQSIGLDAMAKDIVLAMDAAGLACKPENPFTAQPPPCIPIERAVSPAAMRIAAMFSGMQETTRAESPRLIQSPIEAADVLRHMEEAYVQDAYHSLSIEGYQVTPLLIERIRSGEWNPDKHPEDEREKNAMAAKGYSEAFNEVRQTISDILEGADPVEAVERDYSRWYRALFSPSVQAGILEPQHLAGFRSSPVYIRGSRHIPMPKHALVDAMDMLFEQLKRYPNPATQAIMGHFLFGYIHPYMDGNGRMARFLMNALLVSQGGPWTIIRVSRRAEYMQALEAASCDHYIEPFTRFIVEEAGMDWHPKT